MSVKEKAQRLFEYISQVCAIDLPVTRDVAEYKGEIWWQSEILKSSNLEIREFDKGVHTSIHEQKKGEKLGNTFGGYAC